MLTGHTYNAAVLKQEQTAVTIPKAKINISKDDYEALPSYIRCLASFEVGYSMIYSSLALLKPYSTTYTLIHTVFKDLLVAVGKLNQFICKTDTGGTIFFRFDEIEDLGLGKFSFKIPSTTPSIYDSISH